MRKCLVSPGSFAYLLLVAADALLFFGIFAALVVEALRSGAPSWLGLLLTAGVAVGCLYYVFRCLTRDYLHGFFSFDSQGITFFAPGRSLHFAWDDVAEIGLAQGDAPRSRYNCYVYCSRIAVEPSDLKTILFLRRMKKTDQSPVYLSDYVLFRYRKHLSAPFASCLPERLRKQFAEADAFAQSHPRGGV